MNNIKFRAWDVFNAEMFPKKVDDDLLAKFFREVNIRRNGGNHVEVMQYTGLKDRNGVEIYESDVMIMKSKKHGPHNVIVVYDAPEFRMQGNKSIFKDTKLSLGEVIGNIYENPEMVE